MPASCIDNVSTVAAASRDAVRLALITFASRDLLEPCRAWMRYYTAVEHIRPADIYVVKAAANEELRRCFRLLPRRNLIEMPPFGFLRPGVLTANFTVRHQAANVVKATNASVPASTYSERHRLAAFATVQGELFATGYTHTLIVDQDEFVMADPSRYATLLEYLQANPLRRIAAPANAYEVQVVEPEETALDWGAAPLLRGQRSLMLPSCGERKAILSRVPTRYTFSTHNMKSPLFFACSPDKWGSTSDCLDSALWILHTKCADVELPIRRAELLADRDRGAGNASLVSEQLRRRCGHITAWRKRCSPGPLGALDSTAVQHHSAAGLPSVERTAACRQSFRFSFTGPEQHMVSVTRIPAWVLDRI